jgi:hypothetical protein
MKTENDDAIAEQIYKKIVSSDHGGVVTLVEDTELQCLIAALSIDP